MTRIEIEAWLCDWLSEELGLSTDVIENDRSLGSYGLAADDLERLACDIEEFFAEPLESGIIQKRATVAKLTRDLCLLMDTDEEDLSYEEPVHDLQLLQDIGFGKVA
ncbi:MAG: hypothetical protein IIB27_04755 [Chloroflexi bacterium]|nr:hypothetical protein [Chloroflexota bacterium]